MMKSKISNMTQQSLFRLTVLAIAGLVGVVSVVSAQTVSAASLTTSYIRLNRMAAGQTTSFRLVFRTASAGATSVAVNFNGADSTTWTGTSGLVNTTQTVSSASCAAETSATALPGTLSASGSGSTVTISSVSALSSSTTYCVDLTSATAVTNANAGEYHPTITVGSDSTTIALRTITNDQISVNATVAPTFNFVLSGNTDNFTTTLSAGSVVSTSGITATVNTNAKNGWFVWAQDAVPAGLNSTSVSKTIASTTPGTFATLSAGTEGYVFGVTSITQGSGGGTTSASTAYNATAGGGTNNSGSGLDTTLRQVASSNGTASNAVLTMKSRASVSAITPAANDYSDIITVIGAGNF